MIGQQVGSYLIESQIGEGGMGAVYRATHVMLRRPAAIKVLLPQFSVNADFVQRFFNEAKAATSIRHLGIVEIYDFGLNPGGVAYIAMELLRGESLARRMKRGRLPVHASLGIIRQMCGALGAAHELGIVHRDLKPDNVFIVPDGEVATGERIKLLDFGIAKLTQDSGGMNSHKTRTGALMGTPAYMAPEQCRGVHVDHRADIYSLGCMLYELVAKPSVRRGGRGRCPRRPHRQAAEAGHRVRGDAPWARYPAGADPREGPGPAPAVHPGHHSCDRSDRCVAHRWVVSRDVGLWCYRDSNDAVGLCCEHESAGGRTEEAAADDLRDRRCDRRRPRDRRNDSGGSYIG